MFTAAGGVSQLRDAGADRLGLGLEHHAVSAVAVHQAGLELDRHGPAHVRAGVLHDQWQGACGQDGFIVPAQLALAHRHRHGGDGHQRCGARSLSMARKFARGVRRFGADADDRIKAKPGSIAFITLNERTVSVDDPYWEDETYDFTYKWVDQEKSAVGGNEGWQNYRDRQPGLFGGIWIKEWDSWDRVLLRKSKAAIKGIFKGYYTHRDFDPYGSKDRMPGSKLWINNLKARMFPSPGQGLLPWFRRGKIRGNPFNAEGSLCDKPD